MRIAPQTEVVESEQAIEMDALLGLSGKGDIGELFPDSDPAFDGISSAVLLSRVLDVIRESGIVLTNIDCTVEKRPDTGKISITYIPESAKPGMTDRVNQQ